MPPYLIASKLKLKSYSKVIQHGIDEEFICHHDAFQRNPNMLAQDKISCVYVSNIDEYKHQWHVVAAIAFLRSKGYDIELLLLEGRAVTFQKSWKKQYLSMIQRGTL